MSDRNARGSALKGIAEGEGRHGDRRHDGGGRHGPQDTAVKAAFARLATALDWVERALNDAGARKLPDTTTGSATGLMQKEPKTCPVTKNGQVVDSLIGL